MKELKIIAIALIASAIFHYTMSQALADAYIELENVDVFVPEGYDVVVVPSGFNTGKYHPTRNLFGKVGTVWNSWPFLEAICKGYYGPAAIERVAACHDTPEFVVPVVDDTEPDNGFGWDDVYPQEEDGRFGWDEVYPQDITVEVDGTITVGETDEGDRDISGGCLYSCEGVELSQEQGGW